MTAEVGDTAPEFRLPSTGPRPRLVRLSEVVETGTPLLVFPATDETTLSLASVDWFGLVDGLRPLFVVGAAWAGRPRWEATDTPVLADVDDRTASAYGVDATRSCHAFLVDRTRTVRGRWRAQTVADLDFPALLEAAKRQTTTRHRQPSELSP